MPTYTQFLAAKDQIFSRKSLATVGFVLVSLAWRAVIPCTAYKSPVFGKDDWAITLPQASFLFLGEAEHYKHAHYRGGRTNRNRHIW